MARHGSQGRVVYTLGHSSRSIGEFLGLLKAHGVDVVVDVRRWPSSRRFPWFNKSELERVLDEHGIGYIWLGGPLGGYRRFGVDVEDTGGASCFESEGFRAYALYVTTSSKAWSAIKELERLAREKTVAIICRERLPWRCHRKIISDILVLHCFQVVHIISSDRRVLHKPSKCAKILGDGRIVYE